MLRMRFNKYIARTTDFVGDVGIAEEGFIVTITQQLEPMRLVLASASKQLPNNECEDKFEQIIGAMCGLHVKLETLIARECTYVQTYKHNCIVGFRAFPP